MSAGGIATCTPFFEMIRLENVTKTFGRGADEVHALYDVSLEIAKGQIYGVVGASGAGKSTLIRCVNRLEEPDSGKVWVDGEEITALRGEQLRAARRKMGMIFQQFNLLSQRTAAENIAYPLEIARVPLPERTKRVLELLEMVGLEEKARAYPAQLSGGQKQRVGIARAIATNPKVLLSDEATSALDPDTTDSILGLLQDLNKRLGLTILLITHQMEVVKKICTHAALLEDGVLMETGAISDLVADPSSRLSRAFFPPVIDMPQDPSAVQAAITFLGGAADEPILAQLVRKFDVDVNILGGSIQEIGGSRVGQLQVEIKGAQMSAALAHLAGLGVGVEVIK